MHRKCVFTGAKSAPGSYKLRNYKMDNVYLVYVFAAVILLTVGFNAWRKMTRKRKKMKNKSKRVLAPEPSGSLNNTLLCTVVFPYLMQGLVPQFSLR